MERKFYSNISDKPNDDPQSRAVYSLAAGCLSSIDKLCNLSIYQPKRGGTVSAERKPKAPLVRQDLFLWFVDGFSKRQNDILRYRQRKFMLNG